MIPVDVRAGKGMRRRPRVGPRAKCPVLSQERSLGSRFTGGFMHIASSADDGYIQHFAAMVHSAWLYNKHAKFYLLDGGISSGNLARLRTFAASRSIQLTVIPVKDKLAALGEVAAGEATYSRIFIPDLIQTDRVLYLDSDITIIGELTDLYLIELNGFPFAARRDEWPDCMSCIYEGEAVGAPFSYEHYFNAGVMLIDTRRWKHEGVTEKAIKFVQGFKQKSPLKSEIVSKGSQIPNRDQTALNFVTLANYRKMDRKWNNYLYDEIVNEPKTAVLHYCADKVWENAYSPFFELYCLHRNATPWSIEKAPWPIETFNWRRRLRYRLGAALGSRRMQAAVERFHLTWRIEEKIARPAVKRAKKLLRNETF
jgi:lipopolysaccharide biosynthesis glycosyltransferase